MSDLLEKELSDCSPGELVVRAQTGESDAFGELIERFQPLVMAILLRHLRNHDDAQELAQDVLIKAWTKLHQLRVPEAFVGWLKSISIRMAKNFLQRRRLSVSGDGLAIDLAESTEHTPVERVLQAESRSEVHRGLHELRGMDRATLEAFYVQGQSILEMSDRFDAPVGTIKRRLHVARHRLQEMMEEAVA